MSCIGSDCITFAFAFAFALHCIGLHWIGLRCNKWFSNRTGKKVGVVKRKPKESLIPRSINGSNHNTKNNNDAVLFQLKSTSSSTATITSKSTATAVTTTSASHSKVISLTPKPVAATSTIATPLQVNFMEVKPSSSQKSQEPQGMAASQCNQQAQQHLQQETSSDIHLQELRQLSSWFMVIDVLETRENAMKVSLQQLKTKYQTILATSSVKEVLIKCIRCVSFIHFSSDCIVFNLFVAKLIFIAFVLLLYRDT